MSNGNRDNSIMVASKTIDQGIPMTHTQGFTPLPVPPDQGGDKCGMDMDTAKCCPTGNFNAVGGVNETAAVGCATTARCEEPKEWWQWECEGSENVSPIMFSGPVPGTKAWETTSADFPRGFRDRELARHFLRHAGWFFTTPQFADGVLIGPDLVATVAPPNTGGILAVPIQTMFTAVRVDVNTPYLAFAGEQLTVTVGNSPLNPNSILDNNPFIINAMNEPAIQTGPRGIVGWQRLHKISLLLPLGLVRPNQTQPNVGLGTFGRGFPVIGPMIPFNVRLSGFSPGTTMKAALVGNASAGIAQLARSV